MAYRSLKIGIVGCGCSGLVALKEFRAEGHQCHVFEKSTCLGGLYNHLYHNGSMVSSHLLTMFGDFLGQNDQILEKPRMLSFEEYLEYLNDYAEHFHLKEFISFQCEVTKISRDYSMNEWMIEINNQSNEIFRFDRLVICSGVFQNLSLPHFPGEETFQGQIRHFKSIRNLEEEFRDQSICVVGSGESASDMILAAAKFGKKSFLSIRDQHGFLVPRYIHGDEYGPSDLDTTRIHHSIPRQWGILHTSIDMCNSLIKSYLKTLFSPFGQRKEEDRIRREGIRMNLKQMPRSHLWNTYGTKNYHLVEALVKYSSKCQRKPSINHLKEHSIVFHDQTEEKIDQIICCTGFRTFFPFFDCDDPKLRMLAEDARKPHRLYKHCIHPLFPNEIYFIGFARPAIGAIPPLIELQCRWCALLASNRLTLPDNSSMIEQMEKYHRILEKQFTLERIERLPNLTDFLIYSDDLARTIGCRPNFLQIFFRDPFLWMKLMFGPLINAQYRLCGPHAQPEHARQIILRAKWVKQPNILYFLMFIIYSFFWFFFSIESCKPASWYPL